MSNVLYTGPKNSALTLRLPEQMKKELKARADNDGLSINSAIVQRLAHSLRKEKAND
ncbi:Arc family DNA-binding protein [Dickeya lacustris]|uniref:Arc family DNA-binding protein n=1 Tax=Dickeya lacustris TaxID=2259638 RepID=A0ABY8G7S6_9GAMM|nr:Arc family DNA-binding protein [Dickeya lacustris]WFN56018.1 Arc family DNA-binding protein [Dickeya lacustris]